MKITLQKAMNLTIQNKLSCLLVTNNMALVQDNPCLQNLLSKS